MFSFRIRILQFWKKKEIQFWKGLTRFLFYYFFPFYLSQLWFTEFRAFLILDLPIFEMMSWKNHKIENGKNFCFICLCNLTFFIKDVKYEWIFFKTRILMFCNTYILNWCEVKNWRISFYYCFFFFHWKNVERCVCCYLFNGIFSSIYFSSVFVSLLCSLW